MKFTPTDLPEVILVEPRVFQDDRGFFLETYHQKKFLEGGIPEAFVQDNHSRSVQGALRGLHAQIRHPQGKLVRVIEGRIFDVAVDLRKSSPTYRRWVGVTLEAGSFQQLYVPPGFAHGFCVLSPAAQVLYKCTELYDPADEICLVWNDPDVGVQWPIRHPLLSPKDQSGMSLRELAAAGKIFK